MALDFPNAPTVGQKFTTGDRDWVWTGTRWDAAGGVSNATFTASDTAPVGPMAGDLWFDTNTGRLYTWYDSTWVEVTGAPSIVDASLLTGTTLASNVINSSLRTVGGSTDNFTMSVGPGSRVKLGTRDVCLPITRNFYPSSADLNPSGGAHQDIPGLTATFSLKAGDKVFTTALLDCLTLINPGQNLEVVPMVNGVIQSYMHWDPRAASVRTPLSIFSAYDVPSDGSYTFKVAATSLAGSGCFRIYQNSGSQWLTGMWVEVWGMR